MAEANAGAGTATAAGPAEEVLAEAGLRLEVDGAVATVTLNRPERRNAMTFATWRGLAAIGRSLPEGVRVGHDAIRDALTRLVELKGKMRMDTIGIIEQDGVAVGGATWRIEGEDGKILAQGESVEVFRKGPDGWRAAVDCPFGVG